MKSEKPTPDDDGKMEVTNLTAALNAFLCAIAITVRKSEQLDHQTFLNQVGFGVDSVMLDQEYGLSPGDKVNLRKLYAKLLLAFRFPDS